MPAKTRLSFSAHATAHDIARQLFDAVGPKCAGEIATALGEIRESAIAEAYRKPGNSVVQIAYEFDTTRMTVYRILERQGVPVRSET